MPGVSEVAGLVVILINLVSDSRGNAAANEQTIKRSRSIIIMLNRAAEVLGRNVSHPPRRRYFHTAPPPSIFAHMTTSPPL